MYTIKLNISYNIYKLICLHEPESLKVDTVCISNSLVIIYANKLTKSVTVIITAYPADLKICIDGYIRI